MLQAIKRNDINAVKIFFSNNNDIDQYYGYQKNTALLTACKNGLIDIVNLLINLNANVNLSDFRGYTPLIEASENGYEEIVKILLKKKVNIEAKDFSFSKTALIAASQNGHLSIVKLLIENNADINAKDNSGSTSLIIASKYGHLNVVEYLLNKNLNINESDNLGNTSLITSVIKDKYFIVDILLKYNADKYIKNDKGFTAIDYALQNKNEEIKNLLNIHLDLIRLLNALNIDTHYLNFNYYKDYTNKSNNNVNEKRGSESYFCPCGWIRIGLNLKNFAFYKENQNFDWLSKTNHDNEWSVAYHGLSNPFNTLGKIIHDECGKPTLKSGVGQARQNNININRRSETYNKTCGIGVYCSPDVYNAGSYSKEIENDGKFYKIALQCRINPKKFRDSGVNYYIVDSDDIRPYAILIKQIIKN